jgi:hypothetical protein
MSLLAIYLTSRQFPSPDYVHTLPLQFRCNHGLTGHPKTFSLLFFSIAYFITQNFFSPLRGTQNFFSILRVAQNFFSILREAQNVFSILFLYALFNYPKLFLYSQRGTKLFFYSQRGPKLFLYSFSLFFSFCTLHKTFSLFSEGPKTFSLYAIS